MAMRRQRIKAVANIQLNAKRKPKNVNDVKPNKNCESDNGVNESQDEKQQEDLQENVEKNKTIAEEPKEVHSEIDVRPEITSDTKAVDYNLNCKVSDSNKNNEEVFQNKIVEADVEIANNQNILSELGKEINNTLDDAEAFKCPPKVGYQRAISHTSNGGADDVFYSDIEENALQMDLQKSPNGFPMSPSKNQTRQRIRPTPHFGQRRNSFVGSASSPHTAGHDDNQTNNNEFTQSSQTTRRERHLSGSLSNNSNSNTTLHQHNHHTPHKYLPVGITNGTTGRIRTESGCSVFSDTNTSKTRKTDEHNSRQNSRREYEAFFVNGIPDKYALKMSDLIYWNPVTNPMEQKPNPNVKNESTDSSANDVKLLVEKKEIDSDAPAASEAEAVPVPQLKLDSNGELILDDKSLVIETTAEQEARKVLANSSLIYMDENTGMNGFYTRQKRTREWPSSETIKFYRCLQNVGTDFSLMVSLFPNRTRRDLKLKFKKEERINGHLINKALLYPKQFNIETLKQQVEEEEKAREEEAKRLKSLKEKNKELKKKKVCTASVADRVLAHDDIYQNENSQKPKATRKRNINKNKKANNAETTDQATEQTNKDDTSANQNNNNINENIKIEGVKRRRRRIPNVNTQKDEVVMIKQENVKKENKTAAPPVVYNDVKQLETEMNELLPPSLNTEHTSQAIDSEKPSFMPVTEAEEEEEEVEEVSIATESTPYVIDDDFYPENMETDEFENRTFVNLDDGSLNTYNNIAEETISSFAPSRSHSPESLEKPQSPSYTPTPIDMANSEDTCSSVISERELNEQDIQQILTELAEGSLVLVSTLDPDDPDKVLNEIYMVDKNTGDICDEPLNIPDNIVQCILSVMS